MIPASTNSWISNVSHGMHTYLMDEDVVPSALDQAASSSDTQASSLLHSFSFLKDKVHQVQSLVSILIAQDHQVLPESTSIAVANSIGPMIQEIVVTASSMMYACQQMAISINYSSSGTNIGRNHELQPFCDRGQGSALSQPNFVGNGVAHSFISGETLDHWYGDNYNSFNTCDNSAVQRRELSEGGRRKSPENCDIIELDVTDLLAKYTHYCKICGKGFKRDANLRMHMRAHGDEYKTIAALRNPMKNNASMGGKESTVLATKYSCPYQGCRWNKKHAKFQPLKSMICVKNHYKRSHCPKKYACKRCNKKQFSVLSDLRTHEKHCGHLKWQCSCGTTFSRKDKLKGHVALFAGHTPMIISLTKAAKPGSQLPVQMQLGDRLIT